MANINDFKLVSLKSAKYYDFLSSVKSFNDETLSPKQKERLGFYLYMLENISGVKDIGDLVKMVTDTEFNKVVNGANFDDCGVDALYIDDVTNVISIFNFKYRERFNAGKRQGVNDTILSTKFVNALISENLDPLESLIRDGAELILDKLMGTNDIWKLNLYVVSNDNLALDRTDPHIQTLEDVYALEVVPVGLEHIAKIMSIRPNPVNCELVVDKDAVLSFSESSISSSKSYVLRLSINELVRITCNDPNLRAMYNIEDYVPLSNKDIDFSTLFDNVRGFVLRSKINPNILKTLKDEPSKFFLYNNGVTIVASDVEAEPINANKKVKLKVSNFQVLNGGQTLRTIHSFNKEDKKHIVNALSDGEILVRVFKTTPASQLTSKIAEYTNSQNAISIIDLKSLSSEQIQIEQYLDEHDIIYSRKVGDTGLDSERSYKYKISMERFGQILYSLKGNPHKATNQKKHIFDRFYGDVFGEGNLDLTDSPAIIEDYFTTKKIYEDHPDNYKTSDQKVFFILYLKTKLQTETNLLISQFEDELKSYTPDSSKKTTSEARKLLLLTFKEHLDQSFGV